MGTQKSIRTAPSSDASKGFKINEWFHFCQLGSFTLSLFLSFGDISRFISARAIDTIRTTSLTSNICNIFRDVFIALLIFWVFLLYSRGGVTLIICHWVLNWVCGCIWSGNFGYTFCYWIPYTTLCYAMLCYAVLCYAVLWLLCYAVLCYVNSITPSILHRFKPGNGLAISFLCNKFTSPNSYQFSKWCGE